MRNGFVRKVDKSLLPQLERVIAAKEGHIKKLNVFECYYIAMLHKLFNITLNYVTVGVTKENVTGFVQSPVCCATPDPHTSVSVAQHQIFSQASVWRHTQLSHEHLCCLSPAPNFSC